MKDPFGGSSNSLRRETGMKKTLYEILEVTTTASDVVIKSTFDALAAKYKASDEAGNPDAANELKFLNEAYRTLSNPQTRKAYDEKLFGTGLPPQNAESNVAGITARVVPSSMIGKPEINGRYKTDIPDVVDWWKNPKIAFTVGILVILIPAGLYLQRLNVEKEKAAIAAKERAASAAERGKVQETLNHFKKMGSRLTTGISYANYVPLLGEIRAQFDLFADTPEAKKYSMVVNHMSAAIAHYQFAADLWKALLDSNGSYCGSICSRLITDYPEYGDQSIHSNFPINYALNVVWAQARKQVVLSDQALVAEASKFYPGKK